MLANRPTHTTLDALYRFACGSTARRFLELEVVALAVLESRDAAPLVLGGPGLSPYLV